MFKHRVVRHCGTECIEKFIDSVHSVPQWRTTLRLNIFARLLLPSSADVETDFNT